MQEDENILPTICLMCSFVLRQHAPKFSIWAKIWVTDFAYYRLIL